MSFDGRIGSLTGVGLPLGLGVGDPLVAVGLGVGVEVVGVEVGVVVGEGTPVTLSTITVTAGSAIILLDESKPLTDSVCVPSGTEVESQRIADGGEDAM
jgi:hypothetical protein